MRKLSAVPAVAILLSGCGGGGGGGNAAVVPGPVNQPKEPTAKAQVQIKVPTGTATTSGRRKPNYVPSTVGSVRISIVTVNGSAPSPAIPDVIQTLSPTANGCTTTTGSLLCTINATLPIGAVVLAVTVYQSTDGSGTPLSTSNVSASISGTATNSVTVTLGGVPATITLGGPFVAPADGTTKTFLMSVTAKDASGSTIIAPGNYSVPITLAITGDPNGAISLSTTQEVAPSAGGPNTVTVSYNSARALTSATITASATGATSGTTQINPLVYSPSSLSSMVINGTPGTVTVSEAGYSGAFSISTTLASLATISCSPANCTPTVAGGQVAINVQPGSSAGLATLAISDTNLAQATVPIAVASTSGSITIPGNPTFTFDPLTTGFTQPQFPVAGSDGRIWFSERNSGGQFEAGAMTTAGVSANYLLPGTTPVVNAAALGPDNNVWYADGTNDQIDVVASSGSITVRSTNNLVSVPDVLATGPDNQMWIYGTTATSPYRAIMEMAANGSTSLLSLSGSIGSITSMISAPDGNMWFSQTSPNAIGSITPGGAVSFYTTGLSGSPSAGLAIGSDGCLWFTENSPNKVAKIRLSSGTITEYSSGISAGATSVSGVAEGGDGNIWFFEAGTNMADRVTTTGVISTYSSLPGANLIYPVLAPNGELWFMNSGANGLGWLTY